MIAKRVLTARQDSGCFKNRSTALGGFRKWKIYAALTEMAMTGLGRDSR